ncbi:MAG: sigma-70 family RNA polymerase sigma factor [Patescibacteria group bacterium]
MQERTDEEIASRVQQGEQELFGILIGRYEEKMRRYARRFLFDREDGKDLVQEVFVKAYVNIQSFDATQKFSPWIYRIAHNEFINTLRKRSRFPTFPLDPDTLFPHPAAAEDSESDAEKKELREALDRSLAQLDAKYREPLVLYYFEDMGYGEIAEVLQVPLGTVGIRLRRGRVMLKRIMHGTFHG